MSTPIPSSDDTPNASGPAKSNDPHWVRVAKQLSLASGLSHDLGKATRWFAAKLKSNTIVSDAIRHELLSLALITHLRQNGWSWCDAWSRVSEQINDRSLQAPPFTKKQPRRLAREVRRASSANDVVDFATITHHKLFGPSWSRNGRAGLGDEDHNLSRHYVRDPEDGDDYSQTGAPPHGVIADLSRAFEQIAGLTDAAECSDEYWKAMAILVRSALILADHEVSAADVRALPVDSNEPFANTIKTESGRALNQPLSWHLTNVGARAQDYIGYLAAPGLPAVSSASHAAIARRSGEGAYQWQDRAADYLGALDQSGPVLVLNMAGTGSGKTRMNPRALAALAGDKPLRIAAAFNLRTLTLQTHHVFQSQLGIDVGDMACVIGDVFSRLAHEQAMAVSREDDDERAEEDAVEQEVVAPDRLNLPSWAESLCEKTPSLRALIGAPILISTMDYLVRAGNLNEQGHHGRALLRIASSDLILDEIDSYDGDSIVAVLRTVQMAGLMGRNIVASSATLSAPIAGALFTAFKYGVDLRTALLANEDDGNCKARVAFIDDANEPSSATPSDVDGFLQHYRFRCDALIEKVREKPVCRLAAILDIPKNATGSAIDRAYAATLIGMTRAHADFAWDYGETGKRVSFGLIRVANIKTCVGFAQRFRANHNHDGHTIFVTAYHSQDIRIRRTYKEAALDRLLSRKNGNLAILNDSEILNKVRSAPTRDVIFLVVATPVEEVGRDHEFDWGVAEPSSAQSLVQTAGRINRHRQLPVDKPNLYILRYNIKELEGNKNVFVAPGNEIGSAYKTHDLCELLAAEGCSIDSEVAIPLTAELRFGYADVQSRFAQYDDESIAASIKMPMRILTEAGYDWVWATQQFYDKYPLREKSHRARVRLDPETHSFKIWFRSNRKSLGEWGDLSIKVSHIDPDASNSIWLCPSFADLMLLDLAKADDAFTLEVPSRVEGDTLICDFQFDADFGAYKEPSDL